MKRRPAYLRLYSFALFLQLFASHCILQALPAVMLITLEFRPDYSHSHDHNLGIIA
jgi:hypothetical protein